MYIDNPQSFCNNVLVHRKTMSLKKKTNPTVKHGVGSVVCYVVALQCLALGALNL